MNWKNLWMELTYEAIIMGAVYPLWIEKLLSLGLIASGVYAGYALGDHYSLGASNSILTGSVVYQW